MLRIAITGGMACGKSEVGRLLSESGCGPVRSADELAHEAMSSGGDLFDRIVVEFGCDIVAPGGEIDRRRLGDRVFSSASCRRRLNQLVHPVVVDAWTQWLMAQEEAGAAAAAVEVPLLFEENLEQGWDLILCVMARPSVQVKRLQDRGLTREEALERLGAQWASSEKATRSDIVIENSGSRGLLKRQVEYMASRLLGEMDNARKEQ